MVEINRHLFSGLAERLQAPDGGFTVNMRSGYEPTKGFAVSQAGTSRSRPAEKMTSRNLREYTQKHASTLAKKARYFGGWHDPDTHRADLDVSRRFTSHDRAQREMFRQNQNALYNLNENRSEHNFIKLGTKGTSLGRIVEDPPDPTWHTEIQRSLAGGETLFSGRRRRGSSSVQ